jgi:hypothetical protein
MKSTVVTAFVAAMAAGCNVSSPTSPSGAPLNETSESAGYVFRYVAGDAVDTAWQQAYHDWAVAALQVSVPERVTYNKYLSRTHMGDLTGQYNTNGFAEPDRPAIHTLWRRDNHESVHVYSARFGSPVALFNEGLAVAFQVDPVSGDFVARWSGTPVHDLARQFRQQGRLIPLSELLTTNDFRKPDPNLTYPEAGSFMRYLLDVYGLEGIKRLFQRGNPADSSDAVRQQFLAVYGRAIADVERDWWALLDRK